MIFPTLLPSSLLQIERTKEMTDQKSRNDANEPFKTPNYQPASASINPNSAKRISNRNINGHGRTPSRGSLTLSRTASHREVYDAETRSVDGEFGGHSRSRHEDYPHLHHDDRMISNTIGSQSRLKGNTTTDSNKGFKENIDQYEKSDRLQKAEDQEILADIQSGHSAESVLERYEGEGKGNESPQSDGTMTEGEQSRSVSSREADLEKQAQSNDEKEKDDEEKHNDDDLVSWDSPESMENPRNWTLHRRWAVIGIVSSYTFLSPLSSSMIAPALPIISQQFNITSTVEQSLMLSVFVLAYAVGPMLLG